MENYIKLASVLSRNNIQFAKSNVSLFDEWMRTKVKSMHYADTEAMNKAYGKIVE